MEEKEIPTFPPEGDDNTFSIPQNNTTPFKYQN